jgi:hypothetical protein
MDWMKGAAEMLRMQQAVARMAADSAMVVMRRNLMIAQGAMTTVEATRMVLEKPAAFADGAMRAGVAAAQGASVTHVVDAALQPIARKARANARRLGH